MSEGSEPDGRDLTKLVLAATLEGMAEHDLVAGASRYNERWHMLLGFDAECRRPDTPSLWQELTHPDDLEEVLEDWAGHVEEAWPFQRTWRMRHQHGGYRWIECRSVVQCGEDGVPVFALSLFADVTDKVEEGQRHLALLRAIEDTLLRMRTDGTVLDVRPGAADESTCFLLSVPERDTTLADIGRSEEAVQTLLDASQEACGEQRSVRLDLALEVGNVARKYEVRMAPSGSEEVVCLIRAACSRRWRKSRFGCAPGGHWQ